MNLLNEHRVLEKFIDGCDDLPTNGFLENSSSGGSQSNSLNEELANYIDWLVEKYLG